MAEVGSVKTKVDVDPAEAEASLACAQKTQRSGWRSTKLHLALITMVLATVVYAFIGWPEAQFTGYCVTLLGAAGIFSGTRTAESFAHRGRAE